MTTAKGYTKSSNLGEASAPPAGGLSLPGAWRGEVGGGSGLVCGVSVKRQGLHLQTPCGYRPLPVWGWSSTKFLNPLPIDISRVKGAVQLSTLPVSSALSAALQSGKWGFGKAKGARFRVLTGGDGEHKPAEAQAYMR